MLYLVVVLLGLIAILLSMVLLSIEKLTRELLKEEPTSEDSECASCTKRATPSTSFDDDELLKTIRKYHAIKS